MAKSLSSNEREAVLAGIRENIENFYLFINQNALSGEKATISEYSV